MFKILIAGNDKRSRKVAEILKKRFPASVVTMLNNGEQLKEIYDAYLMPIPLSLNKTHLNNSSFDISVEELLKKIPDKALIIAAGLKTANAVDITKRDDFSYMNAVPTAEGAIGLAIGANGKTLSDSNILITGFGRVAKLLVHRLFPFSKNITVAVRKAGDIALIEALGMTAVTIDSLAENIGRFDIIFNTVPFEIFNSKTLYGAKEGSVFIELASAQSGFDTQYISALAVTYINAPGLPGKVAPDTAGRIMTDTVINILKENDLG